MELNQAYLVIGILAALCTILSLAIVPMVKTLVSIAKAWQNMDDRVSALELEAKKREENALRNKARW